MFIENLENIPPKSVIYSITGAFSFIFGLGVLCETLESGKIRWKAIILGFIILILILAIVNYLMMKEKNVDEHEYNIPTKLMEDVYTTDCENFRADIFRSSICNPFSFMLLWLKIMSSFEKCPHGKFPISTSILQ